MWAVGVILIWILSRCINFFPSPDDMTALAEIIVLFGTDAVRKVAINCGMCTFNSLMISNCLVQGTRAREHFQVCNDKVVGSTSVS